MTTTTDWRTIENDGEKYQAYLCSREWSEKREAVRKRANNRCERCRILAMDACHHLNYERKYKEQLDDLQGICQSCHDFTHAKSEFDPCDHWQWLTYLWDIERPPVPVECCEIHQNRFALLRHIWLPDNRNHAELVTGIEAIYRHREMLVFFAIDEDDDVHVLLSDLLQKLDEQLPFAYLDWLRADRPLPNVPPPKLPALYEHTLKLFK